MPFPAPPAGRADPERDANAFGVCRTRDFIRAACRSSAAVAERRRPGSAPAVECTATTPAQPRVTAIARRGNRKLRLMGIVPSLSDLNGVEVDEPGAPVG